LFQACCFWHAVSARAELGFGKIEGRSSSDGKMRKQESTPHRVGFFVVWHRLLVVLFALLTFHMLLLSLGVLYPKLEQQNVGVRYTWQSQKSYWPPP
jgi:hypothetical protein